MRSRPNEPWVWAGIALMPPAFAWLTLRPAFLNRDRLVAFGWMAVAIAAIVWNALNPGAH